MPDKRKLEVNSDLEGALVVLAVNHYAHYLEQEDTGDRVHEGEPVDEVLKYLNQTAPVPFTKPEIWEALENLYTNNNEFAILGQVDPNNEE